MRITASFPLCISAAQYKLKNHSSDLYLLILDVDFFKTINDIYGHLEGDAALVRVASALKQACAPFKKRPYIARYGGDEFIIVAEATEEELDSLINGIHDTLDRLNREADAPYELHVSIGISKYTEGMSDKDMIGAADSELYAIKKSRV